MRIKGDKSASWRVLLLSFCTILLHAKVAGSVDATIKPIPVTAPSMELKANNAFLRRSITVSASNRSVTILCKTSNTSHTYFYDVSNKQRLEPLNISNELLRPYAVLVLHGFPNSSTYQCFHNETLLSETKLIVDRTMGHIIEMGEKDDAALTCNHDGNQKVYFKNRNNEIFKTNIVPIDNRTSILLVANTSLQSTYFQCKYLNSSSIDEMFLLVGTPPSPVENFTCQGQNYHNMSCEFPDERNFIITKYNLTYYGPFNMPRVCELKPGPGKHTLFMKISAFDACSYIPSVGEYKFNLSVENALGSSSNYFSILNNVCVIPPKLDIFVTQTTSNSVSLKWNNGPDAHYTRGLVYDVYVNAIGREGRSETILCNKLKCYITITNLAYAYWKYELTVKARANITSSKWNEPTVVNFTTVERKPDRAPTANNGSFYIHNDSVNKEITVYWKKLARHEENGPSFHYSVDELDMNGNVVISKKTNEASVNFDWMDQPRVYDVRAVNTMGRSEAVSRILVNVVPKPKMQPQRIEQLLDSKNMFILKWKHPSDYQLHPPMHYTVFWCEQKIRLPNNCKGSIEFLEVNNTMTEFQKYSNDSSLIMAVAANYPSWSTGMHWSTCVTSLSNSLDKVELEAKSKSAETITISWHLGKTCTNAFNGYNISYCMVDDEDHPNCIYEDKTLQVPTSEVENYTLVGLTPYSTYRITMALYNKAGLVSQNSKFIFPRTKEAAPHAPTKLRFENISSNSVDLFWNAPTITNGQLTKYTLWQSCKNITSGTDIFIKNLPADHSRTNITYKLENLSSYSEYEVWVTAWTTGQSNKSEPLKLKTLVGKPSAPLDVKVKSIGDEYIFKWSDPEMLSGPAQLYELTFFEDDQQKVVFVRRGTNKTHQCHLTSPGCTEGEKRIEIRAINIVPVNELDTITFAGQRRRRHSMPSISTSAINIQATDASDKNKNDASLKKSVPDHSDDDYDVNKNQITEGLYCHGEDNRTYYKIPADFALLKSAPGSDSEYRNCGRFPIEIFMGSLIFISIFFVSMSKTYSTLLRHSKINVTFPDPINEIMNNKTESLPAKKPDNDSTDRSAELESSEKLRERANLLKCAIDTRASSRECVGDNDGASRSSSCEEVDDKYRYMLKDELKPTESTSTLNDTSSSSSHQHSPLQCENERIQVPTRSSSYVFMQQVADTAGHPNIASVVDKISQFMAVDAASAEESVVSNAASCLADGKSNEPAANGLPTAATMTDATAAAVTTNAQIFSKNKQTPPNLFPKSAPVSGYVLPDSLPKFAADFWSMK